MNSGGLPISHSNSVNRSGDEAQTAWLQSCRDDSGTPELASHSQRREEGLHAIVCLRSLSRTKGASE